MFNEDDFTVRSEIEGLPVIENKDSADGTVSRDTSITEEVDNPTTDLIDHLEMDENSTQEHADLGSPSSKFCVDQNTKAGPKVSFKSLCPKPEPKSAKLTPRQKHSVVLTKSSNKLKLEESNKVQEPKIKVQKLQPKIKMQKEEQKNQTQEKKF